MRYTPYVAGCAALAASLSIGCDSPRATAPAGDGATAEAPLAAAAARIAASRGALADLTTRVIPGDDALAASAELNDAIAAVNRALERDDARALRRALGQADAAVLRADRTRAVDRAELDVVRLALDDTRRLLGSPPVE